MLLMQISLLGETPFVSQALWDNSLQELLQCLWISQMLHMLFARAEAEAGNLKIMVIQPSKQEPGQKG